MGKIADLIKKESVPMRKVENMATYAELAIKKEIAGIGRELIKEYKKIRDRRAGWEQDYWKGVIVGVKELLARIKKA